MKLQKLRHTPDDVGEYCIITHIVDEINLGGEYTVCGRAIPDADLKTNGWEAVDGGEYHGTINNCDCRRCKLIIEYYKTLK